MQTVENDNLNKAGDELPNRSDEFLCLDRHGLLSLRRDLFRSSVLRSLSVCDNSITELEPSWQGEAATESLTHLSLRGNPLLQLPEEIVQFTRLRSLDLSDTLIKVLPRSIAQMTSMQELCVDGCQRLEFPPPEMVSEGVDAIRNFLTCFSCQNSKDKFFLCDLSLESVPNLLLGFTLEEAQRLRYVYLQDNSIERGLDRVVALGNVTYLDISGNRLRYLPLCLLQLPVLIRLFCDNNPFLLPSPAKAGLPWLRETLAKLHEGELALEGHAASRLPEKELLDDHTLTWALTRQLRRLDLSWNKLARLPNTASGLEALETLDLSYNALVRIPERFFEALTSLKSLNVQSNDLFSLPLDLGRLTSLTSLCCANNHRMTLPPLSLHMYPRDSAKFLQLLWRTFELENCRDLDLSSLPLVTIPPYLCSSNRLRQQLRHLCLRNIGLKAIPTDLTSFERLKVLDLRENPLVAIPPFVGKSEELREVFVSSGPPLLSPCEEVRSSASITAQYLRAYFVAGQTCEGVFGLPLTSLPLEILLLSSLVSLSLASSDVTVLPPEITSLRRLRIIDVRRSPVASVFAQIGSLPLLQELRAEGTPAVNEGGLPTDAQRAADVLRRSAIAVNIGRADFSGMQLERVPFAIIALEPFCSHLRSLSLANNNLRSIPEDITVLQTLKCLDIRDNLISSLPVELGHMESLQRLELDGNPLLLPSVEIAHRGTVAVMGFLRMLHCGPSAEINLSGWNLSVLTPLPLLTYLRSRQNSEKPISLDISDNVITSLDEPFLRAAASNIPAILVLSLKNNLLSHVPFPCSLLHKELRHMDVSNNPIEVLPSFLQEYLPHIERIVARDCPICVIGEGLLRTSSKTEIVLSNYQKLLFPVTASGEQFSTLRRVYNYCIREGTGVPPLVVQWLAPLLPLVALQQLGLDTSHYWGRPSADNPCFSATVKKELCVSFRALQKQLENSSVRWEGRLDTFFAAILSPTDARLVAIADGHGKLLRCQLAKIATAKSEGEEIVVDFRSCPLLGTALCRFQRPFPFVQSLFVDIDHFDTENRESLIHYMASHPKLERVCIEGRGSLSLVAQAFAYGRLGFIRSLTVDEYQRKFCDEEPSLIMGLRSTSDVPEGDAHYQLERSMVAVRFAAKMDRLEISNAIVPKRLLLSFIEGLSCSLKALTLRNVQFLASKSSLQMKNEIKFPRLRHLELWKSDLELSADSARDLKSIRLKSKTDLWTNNIVGLLSKSEQIVLSSKLVESVATNMSFSRFFPKLIQKQSCRRKKGLDLTRLKITRIGKGFASIVEALDEFAASESLEDGSHTQCDIDLRGNPLSHLDWDELPPSSLLCIDLHCMDRLPSPPRFSTAMIKPTVKEDRQLSERGFLSLCAALTGRSCHLDLSETAGILLDYVFEKHVFRRYRSSSSALASVTSLSLRDCGLFTVPACLASGIFSHVLSLDMSKNHMRSCPSGLPTNLRGLYLDNNPIRDVEALSYEECLTCLEALSLRGTLVEQFPLSMGRLAVSLRWIDLRESRLSEMPVVLRKFSRLTHLFADFCVPSDFFIQLNLQTTNVLQSHCENTASLTAASEGQNSNSTVDEDSVVAALVLETKHTAHLQWSTKLRADHFDKVMRLAAPFLVHISLSGCNLRAVPPLHSLSEVQIRKRLRSVESLVLSGNQLTSLPPWIASLKSLVKLDLRRNCFEGFPSLLGRVSSLTDLNLADNPLSAERIESSCDGGFIVPCPIEWKQSLTADRVIRYVRGCVALETKAGYAHFDNIPVRALPSFSASVSLRGMAQAKLCFTRCDALRSFSPSVLQHVERLELRNCAVSFLPSASELPRVFPCLRVLFLGDTRITQLEHPFPSSLEELEAPNSNLREIKQCCFENCKSLTVLNLSLSCVLNANYLLTSALRANLVTLSLSGLVLESLSLCGCSSIRETPSSPGDDNGCCPSVKYLHLVSCRLRELALCPRMRGITCDVRGNNLCRQSVRSLLTCGASFKALYLSGHNRYDVFIDFGVDVNDMISPSIHELVCPQDASMLDFADLRALFSGKKQESASNDEASPRWLRDRLARVQEIQCDAAVPGDVSVWKQVMSCAQTIQTVYVPKDSIPFVVEALLLLKSKMGRERSREETSRSFFPTVIVGESTLPSFPPELEERFWATFWGSYVTMNEERCLSLAALGLTALPPPYSGSGLCKVDAALNFLSSVPPFLDNCRSSLTELNLLQNSIAEVPEWLWQMRYLKRLNLGFNRLTSFDGPRTRTEHVMLPSLQVLELQHNRLTEIPLFLSESIHSSIEVLRLDHNCIQRAHDLSETCPSLSVFSISNNSIARNRL